LRKKRRLAWKKRLAGQSENNNSLPRNFPSLVFLNGWRQIFWLLFRIHSLKKIEFPGAAPRRQLRQPGTDVTILWIFSPKKIGEKNWRFLTQNKAKLCKNLIVALFREKNANFFAENWQKSHKIGPRSLESHSVHILNS
jgi:hypothetical protein